MISRRRLLGATLAAAGSMSARFAFGQDAAWPAKTVRIIVPFNAGGAADVLTRILGEQLQARLGQPFVVENRTGAGGNVGMEAVAKSPPDGYTIGSATVGTLSINQFLFTRMPFDPERDLAPVSTIWENCNCLWVSAEHNPSKTLEEFLAWARAKKEGVSFGSSGVGTTPHLCGELFRMRTGIRTTHVAFRGAAQTIPAMVSGSLDFAIDNVASYVPFVKTGKVRGLAVTSKDRWPTVPDIPTMAEAGMADFVVTSWGAFVVPAATPALIVNKLAATLKAIAADASVQQRSMSAGGRAVSSTPQEAAAFAARERQRWSEVVRVTGSKVD